jgi:LCP family protein required for cell wall assembly
MQILRRCGPSPRLLLTGLAALILVLSACAPAVDAPTPTVIPTAAPTRSTAPPIIATVGAPIPPTAVPRVALPSFPRWSRGDVFTVLALGTDRREQEIARSDTIMIATIDLRNKKADVVSIPRDLLIDIPGHGQDRVNAAYSFGEQERPGSGPLSAKAAIERNFQVTIPHWAVVDFQCFRNAVDAVGGVYVDVPQRIVDDAYPSDDYGFMSLTFDPGFQWMGGDRALQYSRTRHDDSDFGRMARQQQVLKALREQLLVFQNISALPSVLDGCKGMASDIAPIELAGLAFAARSIPEANIHLRVIDEKMVRPTTLASGAAVLLPNWDAIRPVVREVMPSGVTAQRP